MNLQGSRVAGTALVLATLPACGSAELPVPPQPGWQTGSECQWHWLEGGNMRLWAESCRFGTGHWQVVWSAAADAFELQLNGAPKEIVVQSWNIHGHMWADALLDDLLAGRQLPLGHDCSFQAFELRPGSGEAAVYRLQSAGETSRGEPDQVPEERCGPYGHSTHGLRYFLRDPRWPHSVIFVNEGQERPMFDVGSIRMTEPESQGSSELRKP